MSFTCCSMKRSLKLRIALVGHIVGIRPGDGNFIGTRFSGTVSS